MEHTCERLSVAAHLKGKDPQVRALYESVVEQIRSMGSVQVTALKTTIALSVPAIIGYLTVQKKALKVSLLLIGAHEHRTLRKRVPMSTMKLLHEFVVTSEADLDDELRELIREAWETGTPEEDG
jgi:hypothetical protein